MPEDIVGWASYQNENPRVAYDSDNVLNKVLLVERTPTRLVFELGVPYTFGQPHYLGVIANEEKTEIYWENTSQPLPQG